MPTLTYHRDESLGFNQLDFAATRVLDTEELASRWRPWFALADGPRVPLRARNALYLARMLTGEDPPEPSTWFSIVSVTSARYQVVRQARANEYLCSRPEELRDHLRTPRWRELVARSANWSANSPQERVLVIALLTQLGFHRHITTLLGTLRPTEDEVAQRLVYETCRALHQLNRRSQVPLDAFTYLAENAARPALGIQAALQLVSALARDRRDHEAAGWWLAAAEDALPRLDREPDWLAHLVRSRYHRAAALHHLMGRRDVESCDRHMTAALAEDDALAVLADGPVRRHYQQENRQLVLEAYLKLDTLTGNRSAPADAAETLIALDPVDPEPRHAIGAWHAANSRWEPAYESFMEAARSGTFRGASAASAAAQCLIRLGRHAEARVAYELSVELDPAAIIPTPEET